MRKLLNVFVLLIISFFSSSFSQDGKWIIDPQSRLTIHGSTNVNTFKCNFDCLDNADTLAYSQDIALSEIRFTKSRMIIPIRSFDCGNKQITKDFWSTLKSEKYPHLNIVFKSLKGSSIKDNSHIDGVMDITLAGTTKRYTVRYLARTLNKSTLLLTGKQVVNFSDFNLEPPQKMMGLIQVQECLDVEFNLTLRSI